MEHGKVEQTRVNKGGPGSDSGTELTRGRSGPVRYELIGQDGRCYGSYPTAQLAAKFGQTFWPDQEQDEDRTGKGWDISVVEAE